MGVITTLLYVLEVIVSALLIGIVLIQQSKSQGGLGALAGGTTESIFGAATGNVITRTTVVLASIFMANTLLLAILTGKTDDATKTRAEELAAEDTTVEDVLRDVEEDAASGGVDTPEETAGEATDADTMEEGDGADSATVEPDDGADDAAAMDEPAETDAPATD
jgi:preprotein translocase subunit SecG